MIWLGRLLCYLGLHLVTVDPETDEEVLDEDGASICARCDWKGYPSF